MQPSTAGHERRRALAVAIAAVVLFYAGAFWQQRQPLFAGASDFSSLYAAGRMVIRGQGSRVYDHEAQRQAQAEFIHNLSYRHGPLPFMRAPFELLLLAPLAALTYAHALVAWYVINIGLLLVVAFVLACEAEFLKTRLALLLIAIAMFDPVRTALIQGQDSFLLLLLFSLVYVNLTRGREALAGCLIALAALKPQFVLPLLLVLLVCRRWKVLGAALGTGLALAAVSAGLVGWRAVFRYPQALLEFSRMPTSIAGVYPKMMPNVRGFAHSVVADHTSAMTLQLTIGVVSALLLILLLRACLRASRPLGTAGFSLLVLVTLLVGYHVYPHDLTLLVLPLYLVSASMTRAAAGSAGTGIMISALAIYFIPLLNLPAPLLFLAMLALAVSLLARMEAQRGEKTRPAEAVS
jgi:Glycosyltransferase family 87